MYEQLFFLEDTEKKEGEVSWEQLPQPSFFLQKG